MERKEVHEVFTPRNQNVNESMYISREELEKQLAKSIRKNIHTLVFGESGNGKSWLFKKVLNMEGIPNVTANCANASRVGSITQEICNVIIGDGVAEKTGYEESKKAKASAVVLEGELEHKDTYDLTLDEPLLKAFKKFDSAHSGKKIIVLDNLESIFQSESLMSELADIIILLDDNRYAECNINFVIVGIPNGVIEYFSKTKNMESVSNRIDELSKVGSLDKTQINELISRGFRQLGIGITSGHEIALSQHVFDVTLGIAQRAHEYCEKLAYVIEDQNWKYTPELIEKADMEWLKQGLRQSYQTIESHLNSRETSVARRNQVIYVIGKVKLHQFDSALIDSLIRKEFPNTIPETNMGVGAILNELSSTEKPLLKKNHVGNTYSVIDPRYTSCIRLILFKEKVTNKVMKKSFTR